MDTIVIIPAYNEEKTLPILLKKIDSEVYKLVVDDCSSDGTFQKTKNLCDKIIRLKNNSGVDNAINKGFEFALKNKFKYIITIDADGQHDPKYIKIIKNLLRNNYDLVITQRNNFPRISEKIFSLYSAHRFNVPDLLSGMKGYGYQLAKKYGAYDTINSIGTELSAFGIVNNYKYKLLKIIVKDRKDTSRLGGILKGNFRIFKALKNLHCLKL
jgi:glycosyltransferase involved in cell wall biosynthesis